MDILEHDVVEFSDEEMAMPVAKCNPVEEHLTKQLCDVESRIERTRAEIEETEATINQALRKLQSEELYGEAISSSDSDCDLYTIEGQPVQKKKKSEKSTGKQILVLKECWKRVTPDKWVIGVSLQNTSAEELNDLQFYVEVEGDDEVWGLSTFWTRNSKASWQKTDAIAGRADAIATMALDLPKFDGESTCKVVATISYRADDKLYQTPLPTTSLTADETVDDSCALNPLTDIPRTILTLKSVAIEKTIGIDIADEPARAAGVLKFLGRMDFREISDDLYVANATGTLMHCLVEILPSSEQEAVIKIFARSSSQMNILLRLLRDEFSDIIDKASDNGLDAVLALIEELEAYAGEKSGTEKQTAKIKTDLLIP